jgi:hypothetical protein
MRVGCWKWIRGHLRHTPSTSTFPESGPAANLLGGCSLAAIATIQSGSAVTIAETNSTNVF